MQAGKEDNRGRAQLQLTLEEVKVLKECRTNSLFYRGIPLGIATGLIGKGVLMTGRFPKLSKWSGLFYTGVVGIGFFTGIGSYRDECMKKILALDNSVLASQFREYVQKEGLEAKFPNANKPPSEFDSNEPEYDSYEPPSALINDKESPLSSRLNSNKIDQESSSSRWDEIRQKSRQPYSEPSKGMTYDQLRQQSRSKQASPTEKQTEDTLNSLKQERPINIESYQSQIFSDSTSSSVLDFSREDSKSSLYSPDEIAHATSTTSNKNIRRKQGFERTNKYGDSME